MKRRRIFLSLVVVLLVSLPVVAQESGGNVALVYCGPVHAGKVAQFEEAAKKHNDWHRSQGDDWAWPAWQIITGEDTGSYCWGTLGHAWEDFDNPKVSRAADGAHWISTAGQFQPSVEGSYWTLLPNVSKPSAEPEPMSSVLFFQARFGMEDAFGKLIGEFHNAIQKVNMPWNYEWYARVSGGEMGTFALVLPRANFAAFNPTGKTFPQVLEEAYGKAGAEALLAKWRKVVKSARERLTQGRPDLSYIPEGQ